MVKFQWQGQTIRRSTRATTLKKARAAEVKIRAGLLDGRWGILEAKPVPTLADFLRREFLPYADKKHAAKPKTAIYYQTGVKRLLKAPLAALPLDKITDQHATEYAARLSHLSPSTINCGLRTLRRALNVAVEWGTLKQRAKITLAKGERQRERVLTDDEITLYLAACPQPWRDAATVLLGTGMRPGEVFALRWERILLNRDGGGMIQITEGKSRAARRLLPMVPAVHHTLQTRYMAAGGPKGGWVFPTASKCGHLVGDSAKNQHAHALKMSGVTRFPPYCLRHTALTRLAESGCDTFTLARIAGHSSITITQRYCHPQADAIQRAFSKLAIRPGVVTEGGQHESPPEQTRNDTPVSPTTSRRSGEPPGTRTQNPLIKSQMLYQLS